MSDRELLDFIQRILNTCSEQKAFMTLTQLKEILLQQNTPPYQIKLLENTMRDLPEAGQISRTLHDRPLTEEDLKTAARRAEERRQRVRELASRGRC